MRFLLAASVTFLSVASLGSSNPASARQERAPEPPAPTREETEFRLEGVIVSPWPSLSVALLRRKGARSARAVQVGERLYGFWLVEVSETEAVVERDGERFRLALAGEPPPAVARSRKAPPVALPAGPSAPPGNGDGASWVRQELDRSHAEARLEKELPVILAETGLTPRVEEGEVKGYRITRLPEGTLLSEAGLLPGDVLLSINEVPLLDLPTLLGLYPRLRKENEIRVVVERQGHLVKLAYHFR